VLSISLTACKLPPANQPVATSTPPTSQPTPPPAGAPAATPDTSEPRPASTPRLYPGTGVFIRAQPLAAQSRPETAEGDITLNFVDADVHDVVRSVLGDVLHLNYAFDPKLQGNVTVQTSRPLRRDDVLPTLEQVLRLSGMAIVQSDNVYRVVPIEEAVRSGSVTPSAVPARGVSTTANAGFSTQIVPLRYVSAAEVQRMLQPFVPKGGRIDADASRNLLIVSGTGQDLAAITDLINTFDVDWLSGMSLGIFPLQNGTPKGVASELETIFAAGSGAPLAGLLRFVPLERINSVLVISPQPAYLDRVRTWIARLDQDDENTPRIYEYHVQNSRAGDLAKVLSQLLSSGRVSTVDAQTAPGTAPAQLGGGGMPSLGSGLPSATPSGGGLSSATVTPTPSASAASPQQQAGYASAGNPQADNSGGGNLPAIAQPEFAGAGSSGGSGGSANDAALPQAKVVADEKNNALVIFAKPRDYRMIEDTVRKLDVVPLQVLIEATIAEVTLNDNLQYGVEWFLQGSHNLFNLSADPTGAVNLVNNGFNYVFSAGNAKVVLNALSSITNVNVISSPQLLVLDHHIATLQVGDQVPVPVQQSESTLTAGAPVINTIAYVDTGVILRVSPRVNTNGLITLDITQQVSQASTTTTSTLNAPTISQRRVDSTITVQDGQSIALGGLITDNKTRGKNGIPVLGDIPVVGSLFSTTNNTAVRTELLILLAPRIVHNAYEARSVTEELRNRLHALAPLGPQIR
jgi:general secretion pathway protein D